MKKRKNKFIKLLKIGILFFGIPIILLNCEKETELDNKEPIETVSLNETLTYFNSNQKKVRKSSNSNYVTPFLDSISQQEIINSNELITVINAKTIYEEHYSRILLLKVNNEIKSVVFSMYENDNSNTEHFSGEIVITDLQGSFINGYRLENGIAISQFVKKNLNKTSAKSSSSSTCINHGNCSLNPLCNLCTQSLDEIVITNSSSSSGGSFSIWTIYFDQNDNIGNSTYEWSFENGSRGGGGDSTVGCSGGKIKSVMGACYCPDGYVENSDGNCIEKPCKGDPVKNPEIVSSGKSGKKGGTFGCTRSNWQKICGGVKGKKKHDGIDIKASVNTPTFAMYGGTVSSIRNTFNPGEYRENSYGNYIVLKVTINGVVTFIKYNHLNKVNVKEGDIVKSGDIIALNGNTGNANPPKGKVTPHIHLQTFNSSWKSVNPMNYLKTKYDNQFNPIQNNCN